MFVCQVPRRRLAISEACWAAGIDLGYTVVQWLQTPTFVVVKIWGTAHVSFGVDDCGLHLHVTKTAPAIEQYSGARGLVLGLPAARSFARAAIHTAPAVIIVF